MTMATFCHRYSGSCFFFVASSLKPHIKFPFGHIGHIRTVNVYFTVCGSVKWSPLAPSRRSYYYCCVFVRRAGFYIRQSASMGNASVLSLLKSECLIWCHAITFNILIDVFLLRNIIGKRFKPFVSHKNWIQYIRNAFFSSVASQNL